MTALHCSKTSAASWPSFVESFVAHTRSKRWLLPSVGSGCSLGAVAAAGSAAGLPSLWHSARAWRSTGRRGSAKCQLFAGGCLAGGKLGLRSEDTTEREATERGWALGRLGESSTDRPFRPPQSVLKGCRSGATVAECPQRLRCGAEGQILPGCVRLSLRCGWRTWPTLRWPLAKRGSSRTHSRAESSAGRSRPHLSCAAARLDQCRWLSCWSRLARS